MTALVTYARSFSGDHFNNVTQRINLGIQMSSIKTRENLSNLNVVKYQVLKSSYIL